MFILGTLDVILNLVNFVYLSSDELNYGLVIGPPTRNLWTSLRPGDRSSHQEPLDVTTAW